MKSLKTKIATVFSFICLALSMAVFGVFSAINIQNNTNGQLGYIDKTCYIQNSSGSKTFYSTIEKAYASATDGDAICVFEDISLSADFSVEKNISLMAVSSDVTLNLSGYNIVIGSGNTLTLGGGLNTLTLSSSSNSTIQNEGTLNVYGGIISSAEITNMGELTFFGGQVDTIANTGLVTLSQSAQINTIQTTQQTAGETDAGIFVSSNFVATSPIQLIISGGTPTPGQQVAYFQELADAQNFADYFTLTNSGYFLHTSGNSLLIGQYITPPTVSGQSTFMYDGTLKTLRFSGLTSLMSVSGDTQTNAGDYTATVSLTDKTNYRWSDTRDSVDKEFRWSIDPAQLEYPTVEQDEFTYNTQSHSLVFSGLNKDLMEVSGTTSATNVGTYAARVSLKDKVNYTWVDGETGDVTYPWTINKRQLTIPTANPASYTYTGSVITATYTNPDSENITLGGDLTATVVGSYTATATIKDTANNEWTDGTTLVKNIEWSITKADLLAPDGLIWIPSEDKSSATARWNAVSGGQSYTVTVLVNGLPSDLTKTINSTEVNFTSTELNALDNGTYTFRVQAIGNSNYNDSPTATSGNLYRLVYMTNDGTSTVHARQYYTQGQSISAPSKPSRTGYNFIGWATTNTATSDNLPSTATESDTYYAVWRAISYNISINNASGTGGSVAPSTYTTSAKDQRITITEPTRVGYTFNGWAIKVDGSYSGKEPTVSGTTLTIPANCYGNITLTATWTARQYNITLNQNSGTGGSINTATYNTSTSSQTRTLTNPTRAGYEFAGWAIKVDGSYSGKEPTVSGTTLTIPANCYGNITLTATWTARQYNITLNQNSGTGGSINTATYNTSTSSQTRTLTNPTRAGYRFAGWAIKVDGSYSGEAPTVSGTTLTIPANCYGNITLTANWTLAIYTITFERNSGTWASGYPVPKSYNINSGEITLPTADNIYRTNDIFSGWYTSSTFSGDPVTSIPAGSTGNKTYYAQWTEAAVYNTTRNLGYSDLTTAIEKANAGETLDVLSNLTSTETYIVDKSLTIQANTNDVEVEGSFNVSVGHLILGGGAKSLTITSSVDAITISGTANLTTNNLIVNVTTKSSAIVSTTTGEINLVGGKMDAVNPYSLSNNVYCIEVSAGTLTISNVMINSDTKYVSLYNSGAEVYINGTQTIIYGIDNSIGTMTINDGEIFNTSSSSSAIDNSGTLTLYGGTITAGKWAVISGGDGYGISNSGTLKINDDVTISGGDSGLYIDSGLTEISKGSIKGNLYGIYCIGGDINISGGSFIGTQTAGIYNDGGNINISEMTMIVEISSDNYGIFNRQGTIEISAGTVTGEVGIRNAHEYSTVSYIVATYATLTVSGTANIIGTQYGIENEGQGSLYVKGGIIKGSSTTSSRGISIDTYLDVNQGDVDTAIIEISGGEISGYQGINTNHWLDIDDSNGKVYISGGSEPDNSTDNNIKAAGIYYYPSAYTADNNISAGTINGYYGIYVSGSTSNDSFSLVISGTAEIVGTQYGIYNESSGTVNIRGGTVTANGNGGRGIENSSGIVNISGGKIQTTGKAAFSIYNYDGTVDISSKAQVTAVYRGIYSRGSSSNVTISGGTVTVTGSSGRGIHNSSGSVTISGGTVRTTSSTSTYSIYNSNGTVDISSKAQVTAAYRGIYSTGSSSNVTISGGTINGSTYCIYLDSSATLNLSGSPTFSGSRRIHCNTTLNTSVPHNAPIYVSSPLSLSSTIRLSASSNGYIVRGSISSLDQYFSAYSGSISSPIYSMGTYGLRYSA